MNNSIWGEHLNHWKDFLNARLIMAIDKEDRGDIEKAKRQLLAIERVRYSGVLNPLLLIEFITSEFDGVSYTDGPAEYYTDLNDSQRKAVASVISSFSSKRNLFLIQGPPGTGKTQVITEICLQLYRKNPEIRILVCSETHVAVNNLIIRINSFSQNGACPFINCVRIRDKEKDSVADSFSPASIMAKYQDWLRENCKSQEIINIISELIPENEDLSLEKALALSANVIGMTCNRIGAYQFSNPSEMFDYAIIDEACKATLPEILMPLIISKKAVLVGDPKQLPPVFCSEDREIIKTIKDCDLDRFMYIDGLFQNSENTISLDTQYRMEKSIGTLISELFYEGKLKNGREAEFADSLTWIDYVPSQMWPEQDCTNNDNPILCNRDECSIIKALLERIEEKTDSEKSASKKTVAVIVPYKQQVKALRETIPTNNSSMNIAIDTVDGFQGKEADIVIFGITRTTGPFRFLADPRRLNVALSRAKDQIIIVGHKTYASKQPILKKIMGYCKNSFENV